MQKVKIDMVSTPDKILIGKTRELYLQVNLEGIDISDLDINPSRPRLNLSLVIDRSGSMQGDKIIQAKEAAKQFVRDLSSDDIVSVIIYDDVIETIVEPTVVGKQKNIINAKIDQLQPRNMTNLYGGMTRGIEAVSKNYDAEIINRVILLSDGLANSGQITGRKEIISNLKSIISPGTIWEGISISTLGIGADFDEQLMESIASVSRGNYYYIEDAEYIPKIVARELTGLQNILWRNLSINFPSAYVSEIYGYQVTQNETYIGDVRSLDELYVIAKCVVPINAKEFSIPVKFRYDDAYTKETNLALVREVKIGGTYDRSDIKENYQIQANVELFFLGSYIEEISTLMNSGDFTTAMTKIKEKIPQLQRLQRLNPTDERIPLKIDFLRTMERNAKNRAYSKKFKKMSSYYSYSASRQNYRKKITDKYGA